MGVKGNIAALLLAGSISAGCTRPEPSAEKVQTMIDSELHPGATSAQIEDFFTRHHLRYSYDKILCCRYMSIIRYDKFSGVIIDIYTDSQNRFLRGEAKGYATFL